MSDIVPFGDLKLVKGEYSVRKVKIINANNSTETMGDLLQAGLNAAVELKSKGHDSFAVNIEVDTPKDNAGVNIQKLAARYYKYLMALAVECARKQKLVKDLNDDEAFGICVACGVPVKMEQGNALVKTLQTTVSCAIKLEDGQYVVYYVKGD